MRKAKVAAIVCGVLASCLIGGFAVADAATITLDDSSTIQSVIYKEASTKKVIEIAAAKTSITSTAATSNIAAGSLETTLVIVDGPVETRIQAIGILKDNSVRLPAIREAAETTTTTAETTTATTTTTTATTETTTTTVATTTTTQATTTTTTEAPATTTAPKTEETEMTHPPMPVQPDSDDFYFTVPPVDEVVTPSEAPAASSEAPATAPVVEQPATQAAAASVSSVSQSDYILLCNAVAHEAGSNNISETEKAKVVEVIMNRVASPNFPNTIYGVLTQKYQFSGSSSYVNLTSYSSKVTDKVKAGVDLYFADPSAFSHGYLYFTGDGAQNHFK